MLIAGFFVALVVASSVVAPGVLVVGEEDTRALAVKAIDLILPSVLKLQDNQVAQAKAKELKPHHTIKPTDKTTKKVTGPEDMRRDDESGGCLLCLIFPIFEGFIGTSTIERVLQKLQEFMKPYLGGVNGFGIEWHNHHYKHHFLKKIERLFNWNYRYRLIIVLEYVSKQLRESAFENWQKRISAWKLNGPPNGGTLGSKSGSVATRSAAALTHKTAAVPPILQSGPQPPQSRPAPDPIKIQPKSPLRNVESTTTSALQLHPNQTPYSSPNNPACTIVNSSQIISSTEGDRKNGNRTDTRATSANPRFPGYPPPTLGSKVLTTSRTGLTGPAANSMQNSVPSISLSPVKPMVINPSTTLPPESIPTPVQNDDQELKSGVDVTSHEVLTKSVFGAKLLRKPIANTYVLEKGNEYILHRTKMADDAFNAFGETLLTIMLTVKCGELDLEDGEKYRLVRIHTDKISLDLDIVKSRAIMQTEYGEEKKMLDSCDEKVKWSRKKPLKYTDRFLQAITDGLTVFRETLFVMGYDQRTKPNPFAALLNKISVTNSRPNHLGVAAQPFGKVDGLDEDYVLLTFQFTN